MFDMPYGRREGTMNFSDIKYKRLDLNMDHHCLEMGEDQEGSTAGRRAPNANQCLTFIDCLSSNFLRFLFFLYWKGTGGLPTFLDKYGNNKEKTAHLNCMIAENEDRITRANDEIRRLRDDIEQKEHDLERLKKANTTLETEKQDALRRLSEVASAKLRDNNPNIVDLNDQCRPTKLAEMFSELYDNEWTNAYSSLEDAFGEQRAIGILLQIVMEAYGFCEQIVSGPWDVLMKWFIDMSFPGAQQTLKWLKDSRKAKIRDKVQTVGAEYEKKLKQMFQENELVTLLSVPEMREYITKTVELCLLMVTTDPPVVLSCPGWSSGQRIQETAANQSIDKEEYNKAENANNEDKEKSHFGRSKNEMELFNKDLFKEYTLRGPYLDFPVWPALFLYKDGPMLGKGVAQGKKEPRQD